MKTCDGVWSAVFGLLVTVAAASTGGAEAASGEIVMQATGGPGVTQVGIQKTKNENSNAVQINARGEIDGPRRAVEFAPALPKEGWYEVWVKTPTAYWPATAKGMGVEITHAADTKVLPARPMLGGPWCFFGTWRFAPGKAKVVISNEGVVSTAGIEAVKFVPAAQPPQERGARPLPAAKDDFERMRDRWLDVLTGPADLDEEDAEVREMLRDPDHLACIFWMTMNHTPDRKRLWDDMNPPTNSYNAGGKEALEHFDRLRRLALAYAGASPHYGYGARMRGNEQLKKDILDGFEYMLKTSWNEQTQEAALGWLATGAFIPRYGAECLLALGDVPEDMKKRFLDTALRLSPTPMKHTGANRLFWVSAHACMGMLAKDAQRIELARQGMDEPLSLTTRSTHDPVKAKSRARFDGMYADGSFVQHSSQPYNHGYGTGMVKQLATTIALFEGSKWQITDAQKSNLVQYVRNGVIPLSFRGQWFRRVTGRAVSSFKDEKPTIESNLTSVAPIAPAADRQYFLGVLKAMQEYPPAKEYAVEEAARKRRGFGVKLPDIDFARKQVALMVKRDAALNPAEWFAGGRVYHNMDMAAHQRPTWAAELCMSSSRICTHESFYQNNKKGWYLGDGVLRLHTLDYRLYLDNYWPTHDPYRLPGTTVDTRERSDFGAAGANTGTLSTSDFAGGASVDGKWSIAAMDLHAAGSSLKARKAWIMLDDEIVCLGSAITAKDGRRIETTIEQMRLAGKGDNALVVDGRAMPATLDWSATLDAPRWLHLAGNVPGAGVGCWFPKPGPVQGKREARTGAWTDIGPEGKNDAAKYTRNYATLWLDHGVDPKDATYQYVLLPGASAEQVEAYGAKPDVQVIACSPEVSAASDAKLGVTAAVFWEDAPATAGIISADKKACVIVQETAKEIRVSVSDPTQKNAGAITVKIARSGRAPLATDAAVKAQAGDAVVVVVDVRNSDGKTFETVFAK